MVLNHGNYTYIVEIKESIHEDINSFKFYEYNKNAFLKSVKKTIKTYNTEKWEKLMYNSFNMDYSWDKQYEKYIKVYNSLLRGK